MLARLAAVLYHVLCHVLRLQGVQYKGIADCFRQMIKTEGVRGL